MKSYFNVPIVCLGRFSYRTITTPHEKYLNGVDEKNASPFQSAFAGIGLCKTPRSKVELVALFRFSVYSKTD